MSKSKAVNALKALRQPKGTEPNSVPENLDLVPLIEKNIAIPDRTRSGKWKTLASSMTQGDSVLLSTVSEVSSLINAFKKLGKEYTTRKEGELTRLWAK